MTNKTPPPPPASQHKKIPEPPELDEVFGKMEVFSLLDGSDKKEESPTRRAIQARADWTSYGLPGSDGGELQGTD